jgi:excinuclease ABC subunit A
LRSYRHFSYDKPFKKLPEHIRHAILWGDEEAEFEGVIPNLERRWRDTESDFVREEIYNKYMTTRTCPLCNGARLKPESLAVTVGGKNIYQVVQLSVKAAQKFFEDLSLSSTEEAIAHLALQEIKARLGFLVSIGLDYLTLDRTSATLAGGEAQRINLATQIGAGLVGVVYALDEPSIGLHQRDNRRLLDTMCRLRDRGNTLIVVEHDESTIRRADYVVDLGPGAGEGGGNIVYAGTQERLLKHRSSLTAKYLRRELSIPVPHSRRKPTGFLTVLGAREHNLKNIDVKIPLGVFVCVTGVSGSGKSTLIDETLYRALARHLYGSREMPGKHRGIQKIEQIDKILRIDQSPIGRTPRSNPATYTDIFTPIRQLFAQIPLARMRGYKPGRFSFNVQGGRCENCQGDGLIKIGMQFLPDVYVPCEVCKGKRYNSETLDVRYKGKNIAEVLDMSVAQALEFFVNVPRLKEKLQTLYDVGLGYIKLGQPATTLSGGEAQRVKLSKELSKKATGRTLYLLDEPTTGLHFADVEKLLNVLHRLVQARNTVLVIEHNLEVIKTADYIIDLGPEGGDDGGQVVACGTPEEIAKVRNSYTGRYLKPFLRTQQLS